MERRLRLAVPPVPVPALDAVLTCVGRVNHDDGDTREQRLVAEEFPELEEGPTMQPIECVPASRRDPTANAFEILDGDPPAGALGISDVLFCCTVVHIFFIACFPGLVLGDLAADRPGPLRARKILIVTLQLFGA